MKWVLGLVVLVAVGAFAYFMLKPAAYTPPATTTQQPTSAQPSTQPSSASAQTVVITGKEFSFTPSALTVQQNKPVQLTFKNDGKYPHNLTIADLGVATKTIGPGEQDTITFTPTKTGTFTFTCTVPGHADRGMTGTLIVQ